MLTKLIVSAALLSFNTQATDGIYCLPGKVEYIQSQNNNVVIKVSGLGWKQLGRYEELQFKTRLSIALAAQASGRKLSLAFPLGSGVVCNENNWNVSPNKVSINQ